MNFIHTAKCDKKCVYGFEYDKDPQGILWNSDEFSLSRDQFRNQRSSTYSSYRNVNGELTFDDETTNQNCKFFTFKKNHSVMCEYSHFQLRNNVKAKSESEIYIKVRSNTIAKYNSLNESSEAVFDFTRICNVVSFDVLDDLIVAGGMEGELLLLDTLGHVKFNTVLSQEESRITNSVKLFSEQGIKRLLVCNNDHKIRVIDAETQKSVSEVEFQECVNDATISNDQNLIAACLDSINDYIVDRRSNKTIATCVGHTDFGFSADWDPSNSFELATGNQDLSVMVWDIRSCSSPLHVLRCYLGAGLSVKYSKNGKYLTFAESADFFSVVDKTNIKERQVLDFFGEISGYGILEDDPDNLRIFMGMGDPTYWSLIELHENSQTSFIL